MTEESFEEWRSAENKRRARHRMMGAWQFGLGCACLVLGVGTLLLGNLAGIITVVCGVCSVGVGVMNLTTRPIP